MNSLNKSVQPEYSLLEKLSIPESYQQLLKHIFAKTNNKDIHTLAIVVGIGVHILVSQRRPVQVNALFEEIEAIDSNHPIWSIESIELRNLLGFFLSDPRRDTYWAIKISYMVPYLHTEFAKIEDHSLELID